MRYVIEIEKSRKSFFIQVALFFLVDLFFVSLLFFYKKFDFLFVVLFVFLGLFLRQGIKFICDFFQKNVEDSLWFKDKKLFNGLKFDRDNGVNDLVLNKLSFVPFFQKKESLNSLKGETFLLSEEFLYGEKKVFGINFKQIKLEGIFLVISNFLDDVKGEILSDGKEFGLKIEDVQKRDEIKKVLCNLMEIFGAKKCIFEKFEEKLYIFFETDKKILYQFSICRRFDVGLFVSRNSIITKKIDELIKSFEI